MIRYFFILLLFLSAGSQAQTIREIDSVSLVMCGYLGTLKVSSDTAKIRTLYQDKLYPYLDKVKRSRVDQVGQRLYYRLQRNCLEFREILDRAEPPKEGVTRITEKPVPTITTKDLDKFKATKDFYYFEVLGDTTRVRMDNGIWKDSFTDGTTSELTYKWINDTEFELIFVKSDNVGRSNFSVEGDRFIYQILSKEDGHYLMTVLIPGQSVYEKFKMYYN